ncbi:hypothetical protein [Streptomyces sp. cmx-18-6]|uniref:hypothetical protein n=1 Tax=Streptomyces sp. cmx-18-6 TaxID=2790930 RepID=UPI0039810D3D
MTPGPRRFRRFRAFPPEARNRLRVYDVAGSLLMAGAGRALAGPPAVAVGAPELFVAAGPPELLVAVGAPELLVVVAVINVGVVVVLSAVRSMRRLKRVGLA